MTEKRFKLILGEDTIGYIVDKQEHCTYFLRGDNAKKEVVRLLNEQHEEIERLRRENKELEKFRYAVFKNLHTITEKGLQE